MAPLNGIIFSLSSLPTKSFAMQTGHSEKSALSIYPEAVLHEYLV